MKEDLLERLAEKHQCFISNLRTAECLPGVMDSLQQVSPEAYSCSEWNYCLGYLFDREFSYASHNEIRVFLKGLQGNKQ